MTEKRFRVQEHCVRSSYGIEAENWLVTNDNHCVVLNDKAEAHMVANMYNDVIDVLNALHEENEQLKQSISDWSGSYDELYEDVKRLEKENEQLKEHLSTWRSSCCNYLNVYSILDNEVSILKETKDLDRFFEKFDKYSRMPFYEVEKSFIELQTENEQLKDKYNEQSVEYEGLEEQIERLLNFKDKVFELFNREIEHNTDAILQATNDDVDCATIGFHTKMLKRYKKELSE